MFKRLGALALFLALAGPAMAQPSVQITAPLPGGGVISVGTPGYYQAPVAYPAYQAAYPAYQAAAPVCAPAQYVQTVQYVRPARYVQPVYQNHGHRVREREYAHHRAVREHERFEHHHGR